MVQMEQLLGTALPYWDWTRNGTVPHLWESIAAPIKPDAMSRCGDVNHHSRASGISIDTDSLKRLTRTALRSRSFQSFSENIIWPHNDLHVNMRCDMFSTDTASYDPVFYLHHSYVDYQFAYWQELQRLRELSTDDDTLETHNTPLEPFNRIANNPYEITRTNSRGRDTFDYRNNLCYEYDQLLFDGMTPQEFLNSLQQEVCDDCKVISRVFVGIVLPKMAPSAKIDFDICNSQGRCVRAGSVATFGPATAPTVREYILAETEVTNVVKEAGFGGDKNALTARISSDTDPRVVVTALPPVVIIRSRGVDGGTVYLAEGARRDNYGDLLDKFDRVSTVQTQK